MKRKVNINSSTTAKNELLRFEKLLAKNLASTNGLSMPNLHDKNSNSVIFEESSDTDGIKSKSSTILNRQNANINQSAIIDDHEFDINQIK